MDRNAQWKGAGQVLSDLGTRNMQLLLGEPPKQLNSNGWKNLKRRFMRQFRPHNVQVVEAIKKRVADSRALLDTFSWPERRLLLSLLVPSDLDLYPSEEAHWNTCKQATVRRAFLDRFEGVDGKALRRFLNVENVVPGGMTTVQAKAADLQSSIDDEIVSLKAKQAEFRRFVRDRRRLQKSLTQDLELPAKKITKSIAPNVDTVYKIVQKLTGSLGGNGYPGPIYGELTKHSMQKMVDQMVQHTGFSSSSRFIDVGSGIGKPNLHVAQYPGVEFSCGVEMQHNRWSLGMSCLKACLNAAAVQDGERQETASTTNNSLLQGNTMFLHNNILEAKTFDPFTHVYMFSIGFPADLWIELSNMWNRSDSSSCQYLICYDRPRTIIDCYEFDVELLLKIPRISMHGSTESHMGYIYSRTTKNVACDPLFKPSYQLVKSGLKELEKEVDRQVKVEMGGLQRKTRSQRQNIVFSKS